MNKQIGTAYAIYGIPSHYAATTWDDIQIPEPEKVRLSTAFQTPIPSVVFIQGTAAPIINQLYENGMTISGISMAERLANPFDSVTLRNTKVLLIHSIGRYTGKFEIANSVISQLIQQAKTKNMLVLLQSEEPWTFLRDSYGIVAKNKIKLLVDQEPQWV